MDDKNDYFSQRTYSLPTWVLSECSSREQLEQAYNGFCLLQTIENGDCLFHSVHLCLLSIPSAEEPYTSLELRGWVASTILEEDNSQVLQVLEQWKTILQSSIEQGDYELQSEYRHAIPLLSDNSPFSTDTRKKIYQIMFNPNIYWGDQYAILVLEKSLNIKFLILKRSRINVNGSSVQVCRGQVGIDHKNDHFHPNWYFILLLEQSHYMPFALKSKQPDSKEQYILAFKHKDIPDFILDCFK